jgi:hypothetical protein
MGHVQCAEILARAGAKATELAIASAKRAGHKHVVKSIKLALVDLATAFWGQEKAGEAVAGAGSAAAGGETEAAPTAAEVPTAAAPTAAAGSQDGTSASSNATGAAASMAPPAATKAPKKAKKKSAPSGSPARTEAAEL